MPFCFEDCWSLTVSSQPDRYGNMRTYYARLVKISHEH